MSRKMRMWSGWGDNYMVAVSVMPEMKGTGAGNEHYTWPNNRGKEFCKG